MAIIKKKYIKAAYIEEAYCDKCGAKLQSTGVCLTTYPAQYPYVCSNPECNEKYTFWAGETPGSIHYEYEDEKDV